jgi:hypothetical protein
MFRAFVVADPGSMPTHEERAGEGGAVHDDHAKGATCRR